jgi:hypothetical protein
VPLGLWVYGLYDCVHITYIVSEMVETGTAMPLEEVGDTRQGGEKGFGGVTRGMD